MATEAPVRRKLATVLQCDVGGSTALGEQLDPESVRALMLRYFHTMRAAIEGHGGTVEKFIGDAVFAVFGVPVAHEDDALRACRAALEMRERLVELNDDLEQRFGARLSLRIGLATSELVAGDPAPRETFVAGEAANVAVRLEAAAQPGEIVVSELTARLAGRAAELEPLAPLAGKGKERIAAYRLLAVVPGPAPQRPALSSLVGRTGELADLERRFARALDEERCVLATIVGEPGVGKSRLAAELSARLAAEARVLTGRCLAYGEGITYWPLAEIVREAAGIRDEDSPEQAKARLDRLADGATIDPIAAAIGLDGQASETGEIAWAFRRLFAELARDRPLLLVVDDIHWAEPTLLELLEALPERAQAPILLCCIARPELLEEQPDWPGVIVLEPLRHKDAARLIEQLPSLAAGQRDQVLDTARGNPLFLEELHAFVREHPDEERLPPSLSALLAARLDRLPESERAAAERGSVEGELFHRGAVTFLSPEEDRSGVRRCLDALAERGLIHPARAAFADEAAFRFKHVLVRDAAYNGTAKKLRAELHERLADWLERAAGDRVAEIEEILGYHLEQAYRYREQLGPIDDHGRELARRAGERLAAAGTRAALRADIAAAHALLVPAAELLPRDDPARPEVLYELAECLDWIGERARAKQTFAEALELALSHGPSDLEGLLRVEEVLWSDDLSDDERERRLQALIPRLQTDGNARALGAAYLKLAWVAQLRGRLAVAEQLSGRAVEYAYAARDDQTGAFAFGMIGWTLNQGPRPVVEELARYEALRELAAGRPALEASVLVLGAVALSWTGRSDEARQRLARARAIRAELGQWSALPAWCLQAAQVEYLAGDVQAAERIWREGLELNDRLGERGTTNARYKAAWLAEVLCDEGRHDEAAAFVAAADGPPEFPMGWHLPCARACLLAGRGEAVEAERLAREAVTLADRTDALFERGLMRVRLAQVLRLDGKAEAASAALAEAVTLFEQKGATAWVAFVDRLERTPVADAARSR